MHRQIIKDLREIREMMKDKVQPAYIFITSYLSIYLSVYLFILLSICSSILSIYSSIFLSINYLLLTNSIDLDQDDCPHSFCFYFV